MRILAAAFACLAWLPALAAPGQAEAPAPAKAPAGVEAPVRSGQPTRVEAQYRITAAGIAIGRVAETYQREGDRYRIDSVTRAEGLLKLFRDDAIRLHSEGQVVAGGLRPLRFEQRRDGDRKRDIEARFDWDASLLRSMHGGEESTHALAPGTQDRLSVMYQFMNATPRGDQVRMHMSNGRKVDRYTYRKVDEPTIDTPAGAFATVHYERVTESADENRVQLWLAKDRFNLAVRVAFEDTHGISLEQTLETLSTR
ncbi:MAG TPA: DUF3108 domain-containing protein [Usitatibacteraceae bacterium]|nr:DUF3108 domain-containing protein [Usitatibacteraceae bacterium]